MVFILFLSIIISVFNFTCADNWPQLQHDPARSGYSTDYISVSTPGGVVKWRWHPDRQTSIAGRVQPVILNNILCLGFYDGRMFALNATTGTELWSFQAGGAILHTAAMDAEKVYFGCHDGYVYAVNLSNGQLAWKVNTSAPVHTAVCLAENKIFIGNTDGEFFAITTSGNILWVYDSKRPILTSAGYSDGVVYCGNEGMSAFALDANTGTEKWKVRLKGQSISSYWPVVISTKNIVIYRTQPVMIFHEVLGEGDSVLGPDDGQGNFGDGTPSDFQIEYNKVRQYLLEKPDNKTFWVLDTRTGQEKYIAPVLYTAGEGCVPVPPVFDPQTNRAWIITRSRYARYDSGYIVRRFGCEPAKFNLDTGEYTLFATYATRGSGIHVIGDETSILSANSYGLLVSARGTLGYLRHVNETAQHILSSQSQEDYGHPSAPLAYDANAGYPDWSIQAGGGQGGGQCAAAAVADNAIFWLARWGLLVRIESQ